MEASPSAQGTPQHNHASSSLDANAAPEKSQAAKRRKVTRACDRCKRRKRRCDGELPCSVCVSSLADCAYDAPYTRGKAIEPLASGKAAAGTSTAPLAGLQQAVGAAGSCVAGPDEVQAVSEDRASEDAGEYAYSSSAYAFLRRAWERFGHREGMDAAFQDAQASQGSSIFKFGDRSVSPSRESGRQLGTSRLPDDEAKAPALLALYFDWVMPTYRFLHRPTVADWLAEMQQGCELRADASCTQPPFSQQAVVYMVLATATLFHDAPTTAGSSAEDHYNAAVSAMSSETGRPRLESVQARFAASLYLLHSGRPNEAWYNLGTTVQLALALGLHRARSGLPSHGLVMQECRKRTFWAVATLDAYMSVMLGRPALINDGDVNQSFPRSLDDHELCASSSSKELAGDKVIEAFILHAKLARIAKRAAQKQASTQPQSDEQRLDNVSNVLRQLADWKNSLPVLLSGAVHPSSLIPLFRRQTMVLRLAHEHATMLVTRPLLLSEKTGISTPLLHCITACMAAADRTLEMLVEPTSESTAFAAFWFTQYVSFNAVSIAYVWLIQRKRGRLVDTKLAFGDDGLLKKAEAVQKRFADAVEMNAPSMRYSVVLEELRQELARLSSKGEDGRQAERAHPAVPSAMPASYDRSHKKANAVLENAVPVVADMDFENIDLSFPLDSDLWSQLDAFPFCKWCYHSTLCTKAYIVQRTSTSASSHKP